VPLVRIDVPDTTDLARRQKIAEVVYDCMIGVLNVPADDRFIVISGHTPQELIISADYLGIERSAGALINQLTLNAGRDLETKRAFYRAVADGLAQRAGVRPEDVTISLVEVAKENWSFGNGVASYA